jgi:prolyl oligopeptidase
VKLFDGFMAGHQEQADACLQQLKQWQDFAKYSPPYRRGASHFYWLNTGLQNQSVLYRVAVGGDESSATVVLDPNALSDDGTVSVGALAISKCLAFFGKGGTLIAYGKSQSGSDWRTIKCLKIEDVKILLFLC